MLKNELLEANKKYDILKLFFVEKEKNPDKLQEQSKKIAKK